MNVIVAADAALVDMAHAAIGAAAATPIRLAIPMPPFVSWLR